jgi:HAE1 family hydrophobic/amphiphilic exporter-1
VARRILGTVVISGMLAATLIAIFVIPVLFVVVERIANPTVKDDDTAEIAPAGEEG